MLYDRNMNKKPPELHVVDGTKSRRGQAAMLPDAIKKRVPAAEWLTHPESFNKQKFIDETSDFLFSVYGIGTDQDKHTLTMLAEHIELYIQCSMGISKNGIITVYNDGKTVGPNPFIPIRNKTMTLIIQLMNEMGLTPRSRLSAGKVENDSPLSKFLKGPLAQ